jgi:hypothetical protein
MSNQLSRLLLLPSVILTNAFIVLGYPIDISTKNESNQYSQKLKKESVNEKTQESQLNKEFLTDTVLIEEPTQYEINLKNNLILISLFSLLIFILSIKKTENHKTYKKINVLSSLVFEKSQLYKFIFIKTTRNIYHQLFYKHYITSLSN